jgi:hypothetical protein
MKNDIRPGSGTGSPARSNAMKKRFIVALSIPGIVVLFATCGGGGGVVNPQTEILMGGSVQGSPVPVSDNTLLVTVSTFAGDGNQDFKDCTVGTGASFNFPKGLATDGKFLFAADSQNHAIRQIAIATGEVTTVAGDNSAGYEDGVCAAARFAYPGGVTTDGKGNLYVADTNNHLIRRIVPDPCAVTTVAGDNASARDSWINNTPLPGGYADGVETAARFSKPNGITSDGTDLFVADGDNHLIRRVVIRNGVGTVTTIAGDNASASQDPNPFPEGGYADGTGTSARFSYPISITTDGTNLYVADTDNHLIRRIVLATGAVTTVAGDNANIPPIGDPPLPLVDGTGTAATFASPDGVATDGTNLFVADTLHNVIRKIVISTGKVTTVAGDNNVSGFRDGNGMEAWFHSPFGITTDGEAVYTSDMRNNRIRKVR